MPSQKIEMPDISVLTLTQKLAEIRKATDVIAKNKAGYNYKYVSIDEILAKVTGGMKKYHVSLVPSVTPGTSSYQIWHYEKVKFSRDGSKQYIEPNDEIIVHTELTYTWINDDDPEDKLVVPWTAIGCQQDPSQALGSGLTYALRQFLMNFFQIAALDGEDPDAWRSKQKAAEEAASRDAAKEIVDRLHEFVTEHLKDHPDDRGKVSEITKTYTKLATNRASNNYFTITDPKIAADLQAEIFKTFKEEK